MTDSLLIELFTEELPPKALARLGEAFAQGLFDGLGARDLLEAGATVTPFATPRRLAALVTGVRRTAPDREQREKAAADRGARCQRRPDGSAGQEAGGTGQVGRRGRDRLADAGARLRRQGRCVLLPLHRARRDAGRWPAGSARRR
jgi:hypothetical protein